MEMKKLKEKLSQFEIDYEKDVAQLKVNYSSKLIEQEENISELTEKLETTQSDGVLLEKLEYWKAKAKAETTRIENLEKLLPKTKI